jgi:hypothetical protein
MMRTWDAEYSVRVLGDGIDRRGKDIKELCKVWIIEGGIVQVWRKFVCVGFSFLALGLLRYQGVVAG